MDLALFTLLFTAEKNRTTEDCCTGQIYIHELKRMEASINRAAVQTARPHWTPCGPRELTGEVLAVIAPIVM